MQERRATGNEGYKKGVRQERSETGKEGDRKHLRTFILYHFSFSFDVGSFENEVLFAWFMLGPRKINISFRLDING